jgi:hypothetical protein
MVTILFDIFPLSYYEFKYVLSDNVFSIFVTVLDFCGYM